MQLPLKTTFLHSYSSKNDLRTSARRRTEIRPLVTKGTVKPPATETTDIEPEKLPHTSDVLELYIKEMKSFPLLTPEGEIELAQRIETAYTMIVRAVFSSPEAMVALSSMGGDLERGKLRLRDIIDACDDEAESGKMVERVVKMLARLSWFADPKNHSKNSSERKAIREEFVILRLSRRAVEQVEKALRAVPMEDEARARCRASLKRLRQGWREAERTKAEFVQSNLRIVITFARKFVGKGLPLLDLIQEGNAGLIRAVEKFDYRRGYRFSTYASWWVRQAMTRAIADQGRTIRVPVHLLESRQKVLRALSNHVQQFGSEPTVEELALETGFAIEKVRSIVELVREPISLETPVGQESDGRIGDLVPDYDTALPDTTIEEQHLADHARQLIGMLSPREQRVLRMRFGIDEPRTYTLEEIGEKLDLTRERIRQIEGQALKKLRLPSESRQLHVYLEN